MKIKSPYNKRQIKRLVLNFSYKQKLICISTECFYSQTKITKFGVPQGSSLVKLLFPIYVNRHTKFLNDVIVQNFYDDGKSTDGYKDSSEISYFTKANYSVYLTGSELLKSVLMNIKQNSYFLDLQVSLVHYC